MAAKIELATLNFFSFADHQSAFQRVLSILLEVAATAVGHPADKIIKTQINLHKTKFSILQLTNSQQKYSRKSEALKVCSEAAGQQQQKLLSFSSIAWVQLPFSLTLPINLIAIWWGGGHLDHPIANVLLVYEYNTQQLNEKTAAAAAAAQRYFTLTMATGGNEWMSERDAKQKKLY